jgi:hypothetical protein
VYGTIIEIRLLSHPTKAQLVIQLTIATLADYVFVMFSGHGDHVAAADRLRDDTMIQINQHEDFSLDETSRDAQWLSMHAGALETSR